MFVFWLMHINSIKLLVCFLFRLHLVVHCRDRNKDSQLGDLSLTKHIPQITFHLIAFQKPICTVLKRNKYFNAFFPLKKEQIRISLIKMTCVFFANHEQFLSTITAHLVIWDNFVDKIWQLHHRIDSIQWMEHSFNKMDWEY